MRRRHLLAAAIAGGLTGGQAAAAPRVQALVGATLIDGRGGTPIADAVVIVSDGRIGCAGSRSACPVPKGATIIDVRGRWNAPWGWRRRPARWRRARRPT